MYIKTVSKNRHVTIQRQEQIMVADQKVKGLEKPLTQTDSFFRKLLDNMQIGIIVSDHEGTIIYLNETYVHKFLFLLSLFLAINLFFSLPINKF